MTVGQRGSLKAERCKAILQKHWAQVDCAGRRTERFTESTTAAEEGKGDFYFIFLFLKEDEG